MRYCRVSCALQEMQRSLGARRIASCLTLVGSVLLNTWYHNSLKASGIGVAWRFTHILVQFVFGQGLSIRISFSFASACKYVIRMLYMRLLYYLVVSDGVRGGTYAESISISWKYWYFAGILFLLEVCTGFSSPHFPIQHVVGNPALRFTTWRRNGRTARHFASVLCGPQPPWISLCRVLTGEFWKFPETICIARLRSWSLLYYPPEEEGFVSCTRISPLRTCSRFGFIDVSGGLRYIRLVPEILCFQWFASK
jgi:hypothetical protein